MDQALICPEYVCAPDQFYASIQDWVKDAEIDERDEQTTQAVREYILKALLTILIPAGHC